MKENVAIILVSEVGLPLAQTIRRELGASSAIYTMHTLEGCENISSYSGFMSDRFHDFGAFVFIGALGICVRSMATCLKNKYTDPAVVCTDSAGRFVVSVLSGHIGGANDWTRRIAAITGGEAVITTQSDRADLWALDTLGRTYGWRTAASPAEMNRMIALFVGGRRTALLLEIKDRGTEFLERTLPEHVDVFYTYHDIRPQEYELIIAVSPFIYKSETPILYFRPRVLHVGVGCRRNSRPDGVAAYMEKVMEEH